MVGEGTSSEGFCASFCWGAAEAIRSAASRTTGGRTKELSIPIQWGTYPQYRLFQMHAAIRHLREQDPVLAKVIARVGPCAIEFRAPSFDTLVRSIVFQQLSGKVARVIYGRLAGA